VLKYYFPDIKASKTQFLRFANPFFSEKNAKSNVERQIGTDIFHSLICFNRKLIILYTQIHRDMSGKEYGGSCTAANLR
jgi:hypothetical protein